MGSGAALRVATIQPTLMPSVGAIIVAQSWGLRMNRPHMILPRTSADKPAVEALAGRFPALIDDSADVPAVTIAPRASAQPG